MRRTYSIGLLCLIGVGSACLPSIFGQSRPLASLPPTLTADNSEFDLSTGEAVFFGNAIARADGVRLTADEIRFNQKTNVITARGQAEMQRGDLRLLADELNYAINTRSFSVKHVRFGRAPVFISGDLLEGDAQQLTFTNAQASFGEPHPWSPTFSARKFTYFPERDRIQAEGGRLGLGLWQPIPFPSTPLPTDLPWVDELTFAGGYNSRLGANLLIGAKIPVSSEFRVGADIGLFSKRGILAGPSTAYNFDGGFGAGVGKFTTGYIHDSGRRLTDVLGQPIASDRGIIEWVHQQEISENLTFHAELNYWSDSEVLRDFRAREFFPVQTPDSFAEFTYTSTNTISGLFLRAQPNPYHEVRQRLPELSFDLLPTPCGAGFIHQAHSSIAILRDDPPGGGVELRSDRVDLYYALTRPWSPESWLAINPVAGVRATHYTRATGGKNDYTRTLAEIGFDAQLQASATFDYQNERWGIDGLRHLITPKLSYRYIPEADKGLPYIPQIDRRVFATYLEPLALGSRRQIDQLTATNTLRLALEQTLQTRDATYGSRDLVSLNLALDSRFDRQPGDRTLSSLHTELHLTPAPFLDLALYHRATPGTWSMEEVNTAITLRSADRWSVQFANHYLAGDIQEFIGGLAYRLNEVYEGYVQFHYDSRRNRFVEQTYGVRQTIANRWVVGYEMSFFEGPRRESDFGFNVVLEAVRF
jgi:LPS-assembly protein